MKSTSLRDRSCSVSLDLDALERRAVEAIHATYGPMIQNDEQRFWLQKGIEGMRLAVAEAKGAA